MKNGQKSVELFHLLFLQYMSEKLTKTLYAVKGGCNLRFFFKSIRYSEDLDIDIQTVAKETLRNKINKLLVSQSFQQALSARELEIVHISEAKQSDTTQRWKLSIKLKTIAHPLPTKIEFSRRGMGDDCVFEPVDPELIQFYQLYPILINHYTQKSAICQKIDALIHRTETQARDIFDLHLLLGKTSNTFKLSDALSNQIDIAIRNASSIHFPEFKSQVVAYLMNEYQGYYNSDLVWTDMQNKVIAKLREFETA